MLPGNLRCPASPRRTWREDTWRIAAARRPTLFGLFLGESYGRADTAHLDVARATSLVDAGCGVGKLLMQAFLAHGRGHTCWESRAWSLPTRASWSVTWASLAASDRQRYTLSQTDRSVCTSERVLPLGLASIKLALLRLSPTSFPPLAPSPSFPYLR